MSCSKHRPWSLPTLLLSLLAGWPSAAHACSCGTQSIGKALTTAHAVIVGRVKAHSEATYDGERSRPALFTVEVVESLTGDASGTLEIAKSQMCYQSFPEDDLRVGKTYLFPLSVIDAGNPIYSWSGGVGGRDPSIGMYGLPVCSHNALLLDGTALYSSEMSFPGGARHLEYYLPLSWVKVLLPTGLLGIPAMAFYAVIVLSPVVVLAFLRIRGRRQALKNR